MGVPYSRNAIRVIHGSVRVHKKQQSDPSSFPYHGRYFFPYSTCTSRQILYISASFEEDSRSCSLLFRCFSRNMVTHPNIQTGCTQIFGLFIFSHIVCLSLLFTCFYLFVSFFISICFFFAFVSLFYSYCSSFFCFFLYSRIIVYRSIMCQINRKMKFNARIDKLNVNLY